MRGNNYARYTAGYKFERPVAITRAKEATREGDALRRRIQDKRILSCDIGAVPIIANEQLEEA